LPFCSCIQTSAITLFTLLELLIFMQSLEAPINPLIVLSNERSEPQSLKTFNSKGSSQLFTSITIWSVPSQPLPSVYVYVTLTFPAANPGVNSPEFETPLPV